MTKKKVILVLGARFNRKRPDKIGGVVVLFEEFLNMISNHDLIIIDTNKENYRNKIIAYISILRIFILNLKKANIVSFHGTANDFIYIAPFIVWLSKFSGKEIHMRKFGGSFKEIYVSLNGFKRKIVDYALKNSNQLFFETKYLVDFFKKNKNSNTYWFPNTRTSDNFERFKRKFERRFVFISTVSEAKGVKVLIEAAKNLPENYTIDVYGPLKDIEEKDFHYSSCSYKGVLQPSEVLSTFNQYDILLLPTFHEGEGYPGIIIEGYSIGIPVITTNWRAIPEIVICNKTGVIIPVKNIMELKKAILSIDETSYEKLSYHAYQAFSDFDTKKYKHKFFKYIHLNG